jgi:ATP-binding cassette subfamily C protein CydD
LPSWRSTSASPTSALDFGHYGTAVTLSAGFLALILAPEFFQPLRDLGTFYHAKAQAVGAADSLKTFLETPLAHPERGDVTLNAKDSVTIEAQDFSILSPEGKVLAGPLNFTLPAGQRVVLVGTSGSGKSSAECVIRFYGLHGFTADQQNRTAQPRS